MEWKKNYHKKIESDIIFKAYSHFLSKTGLSEDEAKPSFQLTIGDLTKEFSNSSEFFANLSKSTECNLSIYLDDKKFHYIGNKDNVSMILDLPEKNDIENIFSILDGKIVSTERNAGPTESNIEEIIHNKLEKNWKKDKRLWIIGIGITVALFLLSYFFN